MDILQRLAEGASCSEPAKVEVDPATEKEIEESTMPMSMLIESFYNRVESDINRAIEVYEMADIIGTAQVLQEGTNVQEAASVVMEGNIKDFFHKIIEKIKDIGRWFAGIFKKIFHKGKDEEKVAKEQAKKDLPVAQKKVQKVQEAKKEASSSGDGGKEEEKKYYYRGTIWDDKGDKVYDEIIGRLDAIMKKIETTANNCNKNWSANGGDADKWGGVNNAVGKSMEDKNSTVITSSSVCSILAKDVFGKQSSGDVSTGYIVGLMKESYGFGKLGPNDPPIEVTPKVLTDMGKFVTSGSGNVAKSIESAEKTFEGRRATIEKIMTSIQKGVEKIGTETGNISKRCMEIVSSANAVASVYAQVAAGKKDAYLSVLNSYTKCIANIAASKNSSEGESVTDSVDLSYLAESANYMDNVPMEYMQEGSDYSGVTHYDGNTSMFSQLGVYLSV